MIDVIDLDRHPTVVAITGSNGAGKTTFYETHLARAGLRYVNADVLAHELEISPYEAAKLADELRHELIALRESFVFETVFSDPVGDKIEFLEDAVQQGYSIVLCFIGLSSAEQSLERVLIRVSQGGHDVPQEKLQSRFPRTLNNLQSAISRLPKVMVYDNSDLASPFQHVATFENGTLQMHKEPLPIWLQSLNH